MGVKAAFLDRDGVINRDDGYVGKIKDFVFLDGVFDACARLQALDYRLIVVTNQAGIARGFFSEDDFRLLNEWMLKQFDDNGVTINDVYYCPDHPEHGVGKYKRETSRRKPGPQMLLDAATQHGLDMQNSIMIGDKVSDIQAGQAAGVGKCYFIRGKEQLPDEFKEIATFNNLYELVRTEFS